MVATDINPRYLRILANTFERHTRVEVMPLDLTHFDPAPLAARGIDTILCLNVLEHVEDDLGALRRLHARARPRRAPAPAGPRPRAALRGDRPRDRPLPPLRAGRTLVARLQEAGFQVEHTAFFNRLGVLGWYLNSVLLRRTRVPGLQVHLQNAPGSRSCGPRRLVPLPFGLSLIDGGRAGSRGQLPGGRRPGRTGRRGPDRASGTVQLPGPRGAGSILPDLMTRPGGPGTTEGSSRRPPGGVPSAYCLPAAEPGERMRGKVWLGVAVSAVLLWVAVRGVSLEEVLHQLRQVRPMVAGPGAGVDLRPVLADRHPLAGPPRGP